MLYHFTCADGARGIRRDGLIIPNRHPILAGEPLVWLTGDPRAPRRSLGLSSHILSCDRMAHRFDVEPIYALHWSIARVRYDAAAVRSLEAARGVRPSSWWVTWHPIAIHDTPE